jgi:hypothetical protein
VTVGEEIAKLAADVREEDAQLTEGERLVYAAAFASACMTGEGAGRLWCAREAWRAVMILRNNKLALGDPPTGAPVDWQRIEDMLRSFRDGRG